MSYHAYQSVRKNIVEKATNIKIVGLLGTPAEVFVGWFLKNWHRYIDVKISADSSGELRFSIRQSSTVPPLGGTFGKNRF